MSKSRVKSSELFPVSQSFAQDTVKRYSSQDLKWLLQGLIFFTFFYFYFWLYVDLRILYHGAGIITNFPAFYKSWSFFSTFLSYPSGPLEYLSAFLSQLFYYSWAGALVITIQAWLLIVCMDYLLKATNLLRIRWLCFILPILLIALYNRYAYHFATTLAFSTAMIFTCLYLRLTSSHTKIFSHLGIFLSLSVILYYLAGGAFLLFAVVCIIYEVLFRLRWKIGLVYLLSAAVIPYVVGLLIFSVSIVDAFCNLLPFSWKILYYETRRRAVAVVYLLYLFPPLILIVFGLGRLLRKRLNFIKSRTNKESTKKHRNKYTILSAKIFSWYRRAPKFRLIIESLLILSMAALAFFLSQDDALKSRFEVDYYAYHKMWPELLASARRNPTDPFIVHAVNRALYHTGRLGYEMFHWPQEPDYLFLTDPAYKWTYWQSADAYLEIGFINTAENALAECLEGLGERPMVLQRLALINMVKSNMDSARIYLNSLSKTLFYDNWAEHYLELLQTDPDLLSDKHIQKLRSLSLGKDYSTLSIPTQTMLSLLLEKNSQNKMAFEYLMAWYMLTKHLGNFVQNIDRLKDFGYSQLPIHYEEASLVYVASTGKKLRLSGYQASQTLRQRIEDFGRIVRSYGTDKRAAYGELASKYRDTYFFYCLYAPSGTKE